ncbi:MAG: cobalt-precorrin-5B (C(1))-methyltransferase CbiD [Agathobacter sp.]|nr:cobalt-precorrin-5B (C(1))-methyltransferase CbiD [Agathobacter sp.]
MRYGFTTGSCAAAAAKAAAYMLLTGREKNKITIETPKGIPFEAELVDIVRREQSVRCAVVKDGGDDPDVTNGIKIYAEVTMDMESDSPEIFLDGGKGVGRVTRPGLDQPVGNAAINHVPREMILREVQEVCRLCDFHGTLKICIYVPEGETIAQKTFNPRLGIAGGISILGTSGIVEPMSEQALRETIRVELRQRHAEGQEIAAVSPGNYGLDFMKKQFGYDLDQSVKCSNFIGDTIDMAAELGFSGLLLTGHIGKLVKLSGGIMNTHSREGDCRMELLAASAIRQKLPEECLRHILSSVTTEEALSYIDQMGKLQEVMGDMREHIEFYLKKRAAGRLEIECMVYSNEYGLLCATAGAKKLLGRLL